MFEVCACNEVGDIVVVILDGGLGLDVSLQETLNLLVLLGSNLLEDIRNHILELLGLRVAGGDQQLLSHRELNCTTGLEGENTPFHLLLGFLMFTTVLSSLNRLISSMSLRA